MRTNLRLLLMMLSMGVVLLLGFLGYQVYKFNFNSKKDFLTEKATFGGQIANVTLGGLQTSNYFELSRLANGLYNSKTMAYLAILDQNHEAVNIVTEQTLENIQPGKVMEGSGQVLEKADISGEPVAVISSPVKDDAGKIWGYVEVAYYWAPIYITLKSQILAFMYFSIAFIAIWSWMLFYNVNTILTPLNRFISDLKNIEREWPIPLTQFNQRLSVKKGSPEVDVMLGVLRNSLSQIFTMQEKYREAQALSALGGLAAQVAHDIRSPLAALDSALKDLSALPREKQDLAHGALGRIGEIARDLLENYKKPGSAERPAAPHDLKPIIEPVLAEKRSQYSSRHGIEIVFDGDARRAAVQPAELRRIVSNLVNNAVEAFEKEGRVEVSLSGTDGMVTLKVADSGKGIPPEVLAKLGNKGETHGKAGGTGLGLYHARRSVESWGGSLKIESAPGAGTAVLIELPAAARAEGPRRAVLLDDDALVHMNWKMAAKGAGVELKPFSTPEELFSAAAEIPKETPFYIDSELGGGAKGEDVAARLRELGFADLTMATGHSPEKFAHLPWLKIAGKEPPWA